MASDKAAGSGDDSDKNMNDFQHIDDDDIEPVVCVHCDKVNKGNSLYCDNVGCGKILTQYSYDVAGNLD